MSGNRNTVAQGGQKRRHVVVATIACLSAVLLTWSGCSIERHYSVLSFFFDGVPDPALLAASRSEVERVRAAGGTIYTHEPYGKEQCDTCHRDARGRMRTHITAVSCMNCHSGVSDEHRYMHGPVAVEACLYCHSPHESAHRSLLRVSANDLCRQCHDSTLGSRSKIPAHADLDRSCLDCHSGHGSHDRFFLHAHYAAPAPPPTTLTPQTPAAPPEDTDSEVQPEGEP